MFSEPVTLIVDYPDSYYSDLPGPIRVGYKNLAKLLLRDVGMLLNHPGVIQAARDGKPLEVNKLVERHVEESFDTMEDIITETISSQAQAIRSGVVEEYSVFRLIEKDAMLRDTMECEGICFLQALVHIALKDPRVMQTVGGNSMVSVTQVNDYMKIDFY